MEWKPRLKPKNTSIIIKIKRDNPPKTNRELEPIGIKKMVKPRKEAVKYGKKR